MNRRKFIIIICVILLVIVCMIPYIQAEKLTREYGDEFADLYTENGFYENIEYLKVLKYKDKKIWAFYPNKRIKKEVEREENKAVVLYVEENHSSCALYFFSLQQGEWKLEKWETIWSYSGSAEGAMWPYYP